LKRVHERVHEIWRKNEQEKENERVTAHEASVKTEEARLERIKSIRSKAVTTSNKYFDPDETGTAW